MSRDFPRNPLEKEGFRLIFNDDFNQSELDLTKWLPFYLPQWSSRERSKANYRIENSELKLLITENQQPWCPELNGEIKVSNLQTGVYSGPRGSKLGQHRFSEHCTVNEEQAPEHLFIPQYGYFEIRVKGLATAENVCAFWMIGFEDHPERSAEICPFELKGWNVKEKTCILGYGLRAFSDPLIQDEFFEREFEYDPTDYHIYGFEWSKKGVSFFLDNQLIHHSSQSPSYPMQMMLNIYEIPQKNSDGKKEKHYPYEFSVDYVRGYQRIE
ncbi:glycoside hydrolase family 16 protein [Jeotgalibacillus sp. R-1-5s-1]|uniref:glycoside hydrolase family 16 protein n=1 Tax=Jeotgalibacillus sp. R-1-5s-1 TaxID=2555897 RepID=UPI00106A40AE|nr:glycoside hydrolase family 16 protein [Jeotgalibacillus sp. R-1-5s-1]TFE01187.1 glycosyl hydrolase family protein [Jeotgalibacillus sp. R-1-5s-1]